MAEAERRLVEKYFGGKEHREEQTKRSGAR